MNVRELMIEVDREIEVAKKNGAWEFDHRAAMEEVERFLCKLGAEETPVGDAAEDKEAKEVAVKSELNVGDAVAEVKAEIPSECVAEAVDMGPCESSSEDLLGKLMKGVRKSTSDKMKDLYIEILSSRPVDPKVWKVLMNKYFPKFNSPRGLIEKFKRMGAVEWDGNLKGTVVWP